jgi:hypothetical protein
MEFNTELIESYNTLISIIENISTKCFTTEALKFNFDIDMDMNMNMDSEKIDTESIGSNSIKNNYNLIPITFIKIVSRYIEHHIPNYVLHKIIKNIRFRYQIKVKFTLSNFQIARLFLEAIFKRSFTKELDHLFDQLKLFGNFVINMNISYREIIQNIYECNKKSNELIEENIKLYENKINKYAGISQVVYKNTITDLNNKIIIEREKIKYFDIDEINKLVYDMFENYVYKIPSNAQILIKNKVSNYITTTSNCANYFKNINAFEHNNGNSYGIEYENTVFNILEPVLKENGFTVLQNIEFEYEYHISGAKLEYDYIIGKIINNQFIILGVFDAKISYSLIQSDINKFANGIQLLMNDKLTLRYVFKKKYSSIFNKIVSLKDANKTPKILMGYFCGNKINKQKETSKAIGSYLVSKSVKIFKYINGFSLNFSEIKDEMNEEINKELNSVINICTKYDTRIYSLL